MHIMTHTHYKYIFDFGKIRFFPDFILKKKLRIIVYGLWLVRVTSRFKMFGPQTTPQTAANPIVINLPPIDPSHEKEKIKKSFPKRTMMILSILQITCGCLAFIFQVLSQIIICILHTYANLYLYLLRWPNMCLDIG